MLINNSDAERRLTSPNNLINRLRSGKTSSNNGTRAMELFGIASQRPSAGFNPFQTNNSKAIVKQPEPTVAVASEAQPQTTIDELSNELNNKLSLELAHTTALETLVTTVNRLKEAVGAMDSPTKLADVAFKMTRVVEAIAEKKDRTVKKEEQVHYHFYMPEQNKIESYGVIDV